MTTEERRALRQALIAQGFTRMAYTHDDGHGAYSETWGKHSSADEVEIRWDVRTGVTMFDVEETRGCVR